MSITNGTQVAFRTSANQTNQNTLWPKPPAGATLNFAMARYPIKSSLAVDVTKTAAIDLRYSGVGNTLTGDYGALANKGAIAICFNSVGALDAVMQNVLSPTKTVQPILPAAPLYLLIASLSFLGLGAQPPTPEWGAMISDGRPTLQMAWWPVVFPGLALCWAGVALSFIAEGVTRRERDVKS